MLIAGFVLRANDKHVTAQFYAELGLTTQEHAHGGPRHYETGPLSPSCVLEIYQASLTFPRDTLMVEVRSIDSALLIAEKFGSKPRTDRRDVEDMTFIYITDPDGRDVMLIERKAL